MLQPPENLTEPFLYVALDNESPRDNLLTAEQLAKHPDIGDSFGFKINLDASLLGGIGLPEEETSQIKELMQISDGKVFVDLKMFNGSRTMGNILDKLAEYGVAHTNMWALADHLIPPAMAHMRKENPESPTQVLGVTITTRMDEDYCQRHFGRSMQETARHFTETALGLSVPAEENEGGVYLDGIIIPGNCLEAVADIDTTKLSPGIRPAWYSSSRETQKQIMTPAQAIEQGADILVCGSPITGAEDPIEALTMILEEMKGVNS